MAVKALKRDIRQIERTEGRAGADTIRLWEGFRDQALLWRALALLQLPATTLAIAAALVMYISADTVIEVPPQPQPGHYSAKQLPDSEFIGVATEVVNLIASYQPSVAETQFASAQKYLWEPALSSFEQVMMKDELRTIAETGRSQLFFISKNLIKVKRMPELDKVIIRLPGIRQKLIGNRPLPQDQMAYYITMTTIPRNVHNPFGIVIVDIKLKRVDFNKLKGDEWDV
ncbi:MAG: hypothetical protein IT291_05545 [Deltaproteobacteria bacterium]|nr:hypothetical protein [Deltaproteobacteria bacterium]